MAEEEAIGVLPSSPPILAQPTEPVVTQPTEPIVEPPAPPSVAVTFALLAADGTLQPATTASILTTRAMYIVADWTGVTAEQSEQLDLIAPNADTASFSTTFPLQPAEGVPSIEVLADGTVRAAYRIGIWGTSIAQYQRTGTWTAQVQLPDGSVAGSASIALTL